MCVCVCVCGCVCVCVCLCVCMCVCDYICCILHLTHPPKRTAVVLDENVNNTDAHKVFQFPLNDNKHSFFPLLKVPKIHLKLRMCLITHDA